MLDAEERQSRLCASGVLAVTLTTLEDPEPYLGSVKTNGYNYGKTFVKH